jgi:leucyl aminopeptidase
MHPLLATAQDTETAVPIWFVNRETLAGILATVPPAAAAFVAASGFETGPGKHLLLPDADGTLAGVLFGLENAEARHLDLMLPGKLVTVLPPGLYRFANAPRHLDLAVLAWLTGAYRFTRYKTATAAQPRLVVPERVDADGVSRQAEAIALGRDLINTPANDLGPAELEAAARALAERNGATMHSVVGDTLLEENFPMIHAVGRASTRAPRLIDIAWGDPDHPKVTLVGKGVCFDTGGLNIKPDSAMLLMKKDMGGAACALAAAAMIMGAGLKVRLRVLIPAVENAISGSAFRPGDVLASRKGLSVEIGNTDAEGRLVLADALALAEEEAPGLIIDFATLTGAARVALGPELPAFFCDDDAFAAQMVASGLAVADPMWRLPFWRPYDSLLDSKIADVNHISGGPFAGAITAGLFMRRFVEKAAIYAHADVYCWNNSAKPGRPEGGEVMIARALFDVLRQRHG